MNCLIFCYFDNGGQGIALCDALNKYTDHTARCVTVHQTYLDYKTDVCLSDGDSMPDEAFDFFIMSEHLPETIKYTNVLKSATPTNTIIRTGGSTVRKNLGYYAHRQRVEGWTYTGAYHDSTLSSKLSIAPTTNILPIDEMPDPKPNGDKLRVAFAPTKSAKGIDEFASVIRQLEKEYDCVEGVPIIGKTWKESVEIKSTCHITFDQFMIPTYANSAIESMYLQHHVISKIDWWTRLVCPDLPIIPVNTEDDLYKTLKCLVDLFLEHNNFTILRTIGLKGRLFVEKHHHPKVVAEQWECLINHVNQKA